MENKTLDSAHSLEIITRMIAQTRAKLEHDRGFSFLLWGYITIVVSLLIYVLSLMAGGYAYGLLWLLIPVIGTPFQILHSRKYERSATTQIDRFIGYIWITIGSLAIITPFVITAISLAVEGLLLSLGVILTGAIIAFKPLVICGIAGIGLSYSLCYITGLEQIIIFAAIFLIMMVIPGHILNYKHRCSKN